MIDEGYYWETRDKNQLKGRFHEYNKALETLTSALENVEIIPGESTECLAVRLEKILKKKLTGGVDDISLES